jgi:hypothetical protein
MRLFTLITLSLSIAIGAYGADTDVYIVAFDYVGEAGGLAAAFNADSYFGTVDVLEANPTGNIPSVATLNNYGGVITYNNYYFAGSEASDYGDNLADYIDNGGHVSVTTWGVAQILGRFASDAAYNPVNGGNNNHGNTNLGTVHEPGHPLMDGVSSITGINYKQQGTVEGDATLVCENTVPEWLGVVNASNNVSAINMCPRNGHTWSGDGYQFFVNSVKCLMIAPTDFNLLTPANGTVIPVFNKGGAPENPKTVLGSGKTVKVRPVYGDKASEDVDFTWEASTTNGSGGITYDWECDDDPAFGSPDHTATGLTSETHTENFTVTEDETWYWRVIAIEGDMGAYTVSDDAFEFSFDWEPAGIESASLGEIKANFK